MINNSSTFCMFPFTGLATREDGQMKLCCKSHPIGDITKETLEEVWNNDTMKRIRKQVLSSERPSECQGCYVYEDQGVESMRQRHNGTSTDETRMSLYPNILDKLNSDYTMPFEMPSIEIRLTNLCNLKCRMCSPLDSTSWNDWNEIKEFYDKEHSLIGKTIIELQLDKKPYVDAFVDNDEWWSSFEKLVPYFQRVEFAGGEPLMDPSHYRILELLAPNAHNIELKYATNLTTLGKGKYQVKDYWSKFKSIAVNASIDGVGDTYEYIRTNAKWDEVLANIEIVKQIPNVRRVVASVAVQATNVLSLDKTIEYFLDDLGVIYWSNFVRYPNVLSAQVLPKELKELAIERLKTVKFKVKDFKLVKENPILLDISLNQIDNVIKFLQGDDYSHMFKDFIEFNNKLDKTRKQGPIEYIVPELKPYI